MSVMVVVVAGAGCDLCCCDVGVCVCVRVRGVVCDVVWCGLCGLLLWITAPARLHVAMIVLSVCAVFVAPPDAGVVATA